MSLPRYPEYKASGIDWLEEVPVHWQSCKLKHLCSFTTGWTPPTGDSSAYEGSNLWANISDLGERIVSNTKKRISDEAVAKANICISPKGSLLFSFKLSVGQVSITGCDMYTNEAIATFKESDLLLTGYAYYALPVFVVRNASENIYGAKLLNQELINSAKVAVPPANEQRYLMAFLDRETAKIDALIAKQEKLLALLAEKRQATISHAVTRGLDPSAPIKDSNIPWLGEVPAHWDLVPCRFLVSERDERNEGAANQNYLSLMANVGVIPYAEKGDVGNKKPEDLSKCKLVEVGDLVINSMNYGIGSYGLSPLSGVCSPVYIVLEVKQSVALREFVYRIFQNRGFQLFAQSFGNGILAHRAAIGWDTLKGLQVVLPSLGEQREIVEFVNSVEDTERQMRMEGEQAIALLKERRSALIAAAVTGQIDVRGAVEPQAA